MRGEFMKYDPWEDKQVQCDYCEENSLDFDLWFAENANHPAKKENYELNYCEANSFDFLKFVAKYNNDSWQILQDESEAEGESRYEFNKENKE